MNYRDLILSDNPAAYWRLGEFSGATAYDETGAYNGTYAGGTTLGQSGALRDDNNKSVLFDGTTGRVDSGFSYTAGEPITIEAWVYPTGNSNRARAIFNTNNAANTTVQGAALILGGSLDSISDNAVRANFGVPGSTYRTSAGNVVLENQWNYVVATFDGVLSSFSGIHIYVNGVEVSYPNNGSAAGSAGQGVNGSIGGYTNGLRQYLGLIDELAVYDYVLTPAQIKEHYAKGIKGKGIYWLRDDFKTDEAAPLSSPRVCEPGPGQLALVQNDGQFSVSDGKLNAGENATSGAQRRYATMPAIPRVAGRAMLYNSQILSASGSGGFFGFWSRPPAFSTGDYDSANTVAVLWHRFSNDTRIAGNGIGITLGPGGMDSFGVNETPGLIILRDTGAYVLAHMNDAWRLLWVIDSGAAETLFPAFSGFGGAFTVDNLRVLDLAELDPRFATDYGLATSRIPGSVTAGQTFTHEADFVMEWTQTALPTANNIIIHFAKQDSQNYWQLVISPFGSIHLDECADGVTTRRVGQNNINADGYRVVIIREGNVIRAYSNNTLRWTYSNATNFQSATGGEITSLGSGGTISYLVTYPRHLEMPYLDERTRSLFGSRLFGSKLFGGTL